MGDGSVGDDDRDPDAPWRPDFDGWSAADEGHVTDVAPIELSADLVEPARLPAHEIGSSNRAANRRPRRRSMWRGAVVVGAAIVGTAVAVVWFGDATPSVGVEAAPRIPDHARVDWSTQFETTIDEVAIGSGAAVVGASGGLTALDVDDGTLLWDRPAVLGGRDVQIDRMAIIGDRVIVQVRGPGGRPDVRSIDLATGRQVWESDALDGGHTIGGTVEEPVVVRRRRENDATVLEFVDPVDGAVIGDPLPLSGVSAAGANLAIEPADRKVAMWSIETMDVVAGPVDSFSLRTVASLDGAVVGIDLDGRIVAYDDDGRRIDEFPLIAGASDDDSIVRADLVGVLTGSGVGVVAGDTSVGFRIADGRIVVVWSRSGRVAVPVATARGPAAVLVAAADGSDGRVEEIVDVSDGSTIVANVPARERSPVVGDNGFVLAPEAGAAERVVEAFDFDARPLWSMPIPATADYELMGGALVVVDAGPDGSTLTVAR